MAKKFMYASFGILALMIAFHLGARYGAASIVDRSTTGIVVATDNYPTDFFLLLDNGEVWKCAPGGVGWVGPLPSIDPPVRISNIKSWYAHEGPYTGDTRRSTLITYENDPWHYNYYTGWVNYGPPGGLSTTQATTWNQNKAEFGE